MKLFCKIFLVMATFAVYFPVLGHDFLYQWDDHWVAMNVYTENGFSLSNLWAILTEFYHEQYAPLNEMLYVILYALFGYSAIAFHAANLLLHTVNVLLVYICIEQLLQITTKIKTDCPVAIAFLTALVFAIHPFNTEPVAWISASKILVYTFYYLLATYCFLLYIKHQKTGYYIFTVLLFVCSFLGKEQAVTFPVWLLLIYWANGRSFKDKKLWLTVAPFLLLSLAFGVITMFSQAATGGGILSNEDTYSIWQRMVYACYAFTEYLTKCALPLKLSYLYPFPSIVGAPLPMWLLLYPLLLIVGFSIYWKCLINSQSLPIYFASIKN